MNPNSLMDLRKAGWYVRNRRSPSSYQQAPQSCYPKSSSASHPVAGGLMMIIGLILCFVAPPLGIALLFWGIAML
jgi:hypothetical protein